MRTTWNTKYGPRRVRRELPTLTEAVTVARDLTEDRDAQAEIAASLMGVEVDDAVRAAVTKAGLVRRPAQAVTFTERRGASRAVVVERKRTPPRIMTGGRISGRY